VQVFIGVIAVNLRLIVAVVVALALAGCGGEELFELPPPLLPVKTIVVSENGYGIRTFPGRVEASRRAELAFRVPGKLAQIRVAEGESVARGEIIAELDPTDYQIAVDNARAEFERAQADFKRAGELVKQGHISRRQYDRDEKQFKQTRATLRQAELNLSYCLLKSPFDGVVARRRVENFEEVAAKQEIFSLRDLSLLEIRIDLPENVVRVAERGGDGEVGMTASFPLAGSQRYDLQVKEISTQADPKTQTFEVKFTLPNPEGVNLLSGMTALVEIDLRSVSASGRVVSLPASALDSSSTRPQIWLFDPELETVMPRPVELAHSETSQLRVRSGLAEGDRVVVAGVPSLIEGMDVYELPHTEQAEY
jgi:RND family efflux transporter MFP subunit